MMLNASNIRIGGGIQNVVSILNELKKFDSNFYTVIISDQITKEIELNSFPSNFHFFNYNCPKHIFSLKYWKFKRVMNSLIHNSNIEVVFSFFGPTVWTPTVKHLMGFAIPHYLYPEYIPISNFSFNDLIAIYIRKIYHRFYLKKNSSFFYTETEDASRRLVKFLDINSKNVFTINNYYGAHFDDFLKSHASLTFQKKSPFTFLILSAYYPHKNLSIIKEIVPKLRSQGILIKFVLTLPNRHFATLFKNEYEDYIINLGPVAVVDCPKLYMECDALLMPSTLEVFSATYVEAMKMKRPILTSNLSFATSICKDSALYFNPTDPDDLIFNIIQLINNSMLYNNLVLSGEKRLKDFLNLNQRVSYLIDICKKII